MTAHRFVRVLRRNAMFILGLIIVLGVTFAAVFAPLIAPFDPNELHLDAILKAPCAEFPLGTDRLGRDVLSRLLYGGRVSLWVGFVAVGISISIGGQDIKTSCGTIYIRTVYDRSNYGQGRCQIGSRYRNTAAPIDTRGADTDASGTAPAMDHGMSGAVTITEFSISIANLC